jgi:hypothetical protein
MCSVSRGYSYCSVLRLEGWYVGMLTFLGIQRSHVPAPFESYRNLYSATLPTQMRERFSRFQSFIIEDA